MKKNSRLQTILVDFSFTLCFPKTQENIDSLNGHYTELKKSNSNLNTLDNFIINSELLTFLRDLSKTYSLHIFTSGYMHTDPAFSEYLEPVFKSYITSKELGMPKSFPDAYKVIANKLGVQVDQLLFIDDQIKNIQAAETAGATGIQFTNTTQVTEKLNQILE